jgi:Uncharacterized protein conserved in bacteria
MNPLVLFSVLKELEVLFAAPNALPETPAQTPGAASAMEHPDGGPADHAFHVHVPLWEYEHPAYAYPFSDAGLPKVYETLPPGLPVEAVLAKTRFLVFLGAADTPTFRRCLKRKDVLLLIFEHDVARLSRFAASVPPALLTKRAVILLGDPDAFTPPVGQMLPSSMFTLGFPVFYALPGFAPQCCAPDAGSAPEARLVRLVEGLFYRHRMYQLSGQRNARSLPMRPMARGMFYDQQKHAYDNIAEYLRWPDIRPLRGAFRGETAVLVAAGPDLPQRLDYLRQVQRDAVLIAVNNALKPLIAAGLHPHFVVANDTSVHTAESWAGLPPLPDVSLVAHCLADLGGATFGRKFLFGNDMPELFGNRGNLRLHGSVITTAFSLARHMGCARCVLVGAQLCSPDPWTLAYARGSIHEGADEAQAKRPLVYAWPQLVPVADMAGNTRYTTLNFFDAAQWLRDEIRTSGVPCITLTTETILHGPGIRHIADCPVEPTGLLPRRLARAALLPAPKLDRAPVAAMAAREKKMWSTITDGVQAILAHHGPTFAAAAVQLLAQFEQNNVSYLVQRYEDFDNQRFHAAYFASENEEQKAWGLRYYLEYVERMARGFVHQLERQEELLRKMG